MYPFNRGCNSTHTQESEGSKNRPTPLHTRTGSQQLSFPEISSWNSPSSGSLQQGRNPPECPKAKAPPQSRLRNFTQKLHPKLLCFFFAHWAKISQKQHFLPIFFLTTFPPSPPTHHKNHQASQEIFNQHYERHFASLSRSGSLQSTLAAVLLFHSQHHHRDPTTTTTNDDDDVDEDDSRIFSSLGRKNWNFATRPLNTPEFCRTPVVCWPMSSSFLNWRKHAKQHTHFGSSFFLFSSWRS